MIKLKTRMALRRQGAHLNRINRGYDMRPNVRSSLRSSFCIDRHCSLFLAKARREGWFAPRGGARVRGEP